MGASEDREATYPLSRRQLVVKEGEWPGPVEQSRRRRISEERPSATRVLSYLRLGILLPFTRFVDGVRWIIDADRDKV